MRILIRPMVMDRPVAIRNKTNPKEVPISKLRRIWLINEMYLLLAWSISKKPRPETGAPCLILYFATGGGGPTSGYSWITFHTYLPSIFAFSTIKTLRIAIPSEVNLRGPEGIW